MKTKTTMTTIKDIKRIPFYIFKYMIFLLSFVGLLVIISPSEQKMPKFEPLLTTEIDPKITTGNLFKKPNPTETECWESLERSLAILDNVNPEIANWVRNQKKNNRLVFDMVLRQYSADAVTPIAKFNFLNRKLYIYRSLFAESDGVRAMILAHEYRHSRQSYVKALQYVLSFVGTRKGDHSVVENDAILFEIQAGQSIFGATQVAGYLPDSY